VAAGAAGIAGGVDAIAEDIAGAGTGFDAAAGLITVDVAGAGVCWENACGAVMAIARPNAKANFLLLFICQSGAKSPAAGRTGKHVSGVFGMINGPPLHRNKL
jgi:hypothetical protein